MRNTFTALCLTATLLLLGCSDEPRPSAAKKTAETEPAATDKQTTAVLQPNASAQPDVRVTASKPKLADARTPERAFAAMSTEAQLVTLKSGQTVSALLSKHGFSAQQIANLAIALRKVVPLNKLQAGSIIAIDYVAGQRQVSLAGEYAVRVDATLTGDDWIVTKSKVPTRIEVAEHAIVINHSLYGDGAAAGIPGDVINSALLALSHFIDFQRQVYSGNRFEVVFERTLLTED